jgi:lipopolysaccharide heptosyltransferase II
LNRKDRPRAKPAFPRKILLIRLRRIGDIIMTTPAIAALKRALPQASLTYVVEEPYRRLVEGNPDIDKVVLVPPHQDVLSFLSLVRRVRREKYDIVIDFHGGPRASRLAWLSRAGLKVGYELKNKGFIYDIRVPRHQLGAPVHSVENHLNLVRAAGIEVHAPRPRLTLPAAGKEELDRIDKLWSGHRFIEAKVVVLHIGAGNAFRDWGHQKLAGLVERLAGLLGVRVILVGSALDVPRAEEIRKTSPKPVLSLAGELNLVELREVISRAALFAGPDSGPMHIAATTSTPIVALFGPTLPANFSPWQARATLLEKSLACRPCKQKKCLTEDFRCLQSITIDEVFRACLSHL